MKPWTMPDNIIGDPTREQVADVVRLTEEINAVRFSAPKGQMELHSFADREDALYLYCLTVIHLGEELRDRHKNRANMMLVQRIPSVVQTLAYATDREAWSDATRRSIQTTVQLINALWESDEVGAGVHTAAVIALPDPARTVWLFQAVYLLQGIYSDLRSNRTAKAFTNLETDTIWQA